MSLVSVQNKICRLCKNNIVTVTNMITFTLSVYQVVEKAVQEMKNLESRTYKKKDSDGNQDNYEVDTIKYVW